MSWKSTVASTIELLVVQDVALGGDWVRHAENTTSRVFCCGSGHMLRLPAQSTVNVVVDGAALPWEPRSTGKVLVSPGSDKTEPSGRQSDPEAAGLLSN